MSSDKTLVNRIPFEEIEGFSSFQFPNLGNNGRVIPSVKKDDKNKEARDARKPKGKEIIEDVTDVTPAPLTAEQLKQLTETAEKEAREEGYKNGFEEGMKQGEKKGAQLGEQKAYRETKKVLTEKLQTFERLADALFQPATDQNASLENTVLTMAAELAKHFIHTELSLNPTLMFPTVEQAVASLPAGVKNISVLVNPLDLPFVEEEFSNKKGLWQFLGDAKMSRGSCKVESAVSTVDFSFERRIEDWRKSIDAVGEPDEPIVPANDYRPPQVKVPEPEPVKEPESSLNKIEQAPELDTNAEVDELEKPATKSPSGETLDTPVTDTPKTDTPIADTPIKDANLEQVDLDRSPTNSPLKPDNHQDEKPHE